MPNPFAVQNTTETYGFGLPLDGIMRLDRGVEANFGFIQSLALFKNIQAPALFEILQNGHIVSHPKGAFIFTQGETLTHFSIILDGWLKLFKNSQDGKETTLQLLGRKDFLFEAGITNSALCPMNVQVVENLRVLTLPLGTIKDQFSKNKQFAENLLNLFTLRTQNILAHLENLTLRNAKDRVGFLFLKIWMENNPQGLDVRLPFDKSLMAAYLDIRPETFSRILKDLQSDGFKINGPIVTMPHAKALCRFCDPATAQSCLHAEKHCLEINPVRQR